VLDDGEQEEQPSFLAGQWLDLFVPDSDDIGGYSMCSPPSELAQNGRLRLAVKRSMWSPARWMHERATEGREVSIRIGGDFHYPNERTTANPRHHILLVAGGVGINPILAIMLHFAEQQDSAVGRCHLLYSAKREEELIFREKIDGVFKGKKAGNVVYFLTGDSNDGQKRISDRNLKRSVESLKESSEVTTVFAYICGPTAMIKDVKASLVNNCSLDAGNVFYELWE